MDRLAGRYTVTPRAGPHSPGTEHEDDMALVDNAVYVDGRRSADPRSLDETYELLRERHGMAWIGLYRPDVAEIRSVGGFGASPGNRGLKLATDPHQRSH